MNLHIRQLAGQNNHHIIEAIFKSFAKALDEAVGYDQELQMFCLQKEHYSR